MLVRAVGDTRSVLIMCVCTCVYIVIVCTCVYMVIVCACVYMVILLSYSECPADPMLQRNDTSVKAHLHSIARSARLKRRMYLYGVHTCTP